MCRYLILWNLASQENRIKLKENKTGHEKFIFRANFFLKIDYCTISERNCSREVLKINSFVDFGKLPENRDLYFYCKYTL